MAMGLGLRDTVVSRARRINITVHISSNRSRARRIYIQVNKKFCELKGGNIGIVEKAQETRFGMSPKYSRYIGIAS